MDIIQNPLLVSTLVFAASVTAAAIMNIISSWAQDRRLVKRMHLDWERQDIVALRLYADNAKVAVAGQATNDKLDTIHTLVNSNLTQEIRGKRDLAKINLLLLKEVMELKHKAGVKPSGEAVDAIRVASAGLAELEIILAERAGHGDARENSGG